MPHFRGGNRQAPIRRKTYIHYHAEHSGTSDGWCAWMISGGGALARHRCVRMFSSMRTTSYQPSRLSSLRRITERSGLMDLNKVRSAQGNEGG